MNNCAMKGSSSIQDIEKILIEAKTILSQNPNQSISLAKESYRLSEVKSFSAGMIKSKIILIKGNIYSGDMVTAARLCEETLVNIKEKKGLEYENAEIQLCLSNIYYYFGEFDLALEHITPNTRPSNTKIDLILKAKSLTLQGNVQSRQNNYSEAFSSFKKSLDIKQDMNYESESIAKSLMNLATVYIHLDDLQKALKYTNEAGKHLETTSGHTKCIHFLNTGVILGKQGLFPEAIDKLETALDICKTHNLNRLKASALSNLGEFHYLNGNVEQSLIYANKGISLCEEYNFRNKIYITCILTIFRCYHASDSLEAAAQIGKESIGLCKEISYNDLALDLLRELVIVLEKLGRINEALSVSKDIVNLQTKIYHKKRNYDIFQIQSKLEIQMKEKELTMQRELIQQKDKHNKELMNINMELDKFVGIASHDLKEPIRTINSFSKILSKYISEDQREYEYLHYIQEASNSMSTLVEDLLSFARAGKYTTPRKQIALDDVVFLVKQNLRNTIDMSNTQIIHKQLPDIIAHRTPLLQLFQNIIANSIKYSKKDESPIIIITASESIDETTIVIEDNGLGIDSNKLAYIFNPFTRIYRKTDKRGSGIGLATCKRIVERYDGKIWATSKVGKGTRIHISIPNVTI